MDDLKQKIQKLELTKTEKTVADYILDNMDSIPFLTVTDMAQQSGVSDTSWCASSRRCVRASRA